MSLPNLLFVTPVRPDSVGSGTMLRSAMSLEALSRRFQVHVLNLNLWRANLGNISFVRDLAVSYAEVPWRNGEIATGALLDTFFGGVEFAAIHTFRLAVARVTVGLLARTPPPHPYLVLDLDDDELVRSTRILNLLDADTDLENLTHARAEQAQLRTLEKMLAPRFNAICLAGLDDRRTVTARYPGVSVHHLPNGVWLRSLSADRVPRRRDAAATLLFVGVLDYAPNADGICFFCEHVLPLIQNRSAVPVSVQVVGSAPPQRVASLARNPAVTIHANVPSVEPYYRGADVCVVPLRAGSGTRIKILEAFSFRRPAVSTHLGAEGLAVLDGEHLLLADEPEDMARACLKMLDDCESRDRMVHSAYEWVCENHSTASVQAAIDSIYRPVLDAAPRA